MTLFTKKVNYEKTTTYGPHMAQSTTMINLPQLTVPLVPLPFSPTVRYGPWLLATEHEGSLSRPELKRNIAGSQQEK